MLNRSQRDADYVEVGIDTGVCYDPLHNELDPYAVATLLNNPFGKSKEPFWQQTYTDLLKFVILLRRIPEGYTPVSEVYRYIRDDSQIDRDIRRLKDSAQRLAGRLGERTLTTATSRRSQPRDDTCRQSCGLCSPETARGWMGRSKAPTRSRRARVRPWLEPIGGQLRSRPAGRAHRQLLGPCKVLAKPCVHRVLRRPSVTTHALIEPCVPANARPGRMRDSHSIAPPAESSPRCSDRVTRLGVRATRRSSTARRRPLALTCSRPRPRSRTRMPPLFEPRRSSGGVRDVRTGRPSFAIDRRRRPRPPCSDSAPGHHAA